MKKYKGLNETLNEEQKKLNTVLLNGEFYEKNTSIWSVIKGLTREEKALCKAVLKQKKQTTNLRTIVMYNKLVLKDNEENRERLEYYKQVSFQDALSNCVWHALNYKAENDTTLSFMDLYSSGYMSLENAWSNFLNKSEEEIEKDKAEGKVVYASFKTYSENYIKNAIAVEIMKQKSIDESKIDICKSAKYKFNQINKAIQTFICMNGKIPSDSILSEMTGYSIKTIQAARFTMNEGNYDEKNNFETAQIVKDIDFSEIAADIAGPLNDKISNDSKKKFWKDIQTEYGDRNYKILWAYFYQGKTLQEIGDELGLTRERVRQLLNTMYSNIKNNPELLETLYNTVR